MKYSFNLLLVIVVVMGVGCAVLRSEPEIASREVEINAQDGIDSAEASVIAQRYFNAQYGGCGGAGKPEDDGARWSFRPVVGYAGLPLDERIFVSKKDGKVTIQKTSDGNITQRGNTGEPAK